MKLENDKEILESRAEQNRRLKKTERSGLVSKYSPADNLCTLPLRSNIC